MALTFIKQNGKSIAFTLGGTVPEITPVSADAPIAVVADGTEKYMLLAAGFPMPRIKGAVTLPRDFAQLAAFNLKGIVDKYGAKATAYAAAKAKPKGIALAHDEDDEEEAPDSE